MVRNKKRMLLVSMLSVATLSAGAIIVASNAIGSNIISADAEYGLILDGSNGNATAASYKTSSSDAKTVLENNVSVDYKNMEIVSGKVGRILAGGFYKNHDPLNDMNGIKVESNASVGDATLYYGPTSGYMPNSIDLASLSTKTVLVGANFFKIVANNDVEITSISVAYGCENKDYGPVALNGDGNPVANAYKFTFATDHYYMSRNTAYSSAKTVIVPDFYDDGVNGLAPVTVLGDGTSTGCFEGNSTLATVYLTDRITSATRYLFYSSNAVTEYTMPVNMASTESNPLPKTNLEVLNIESKHLIATSTGISSSNTPKLHTINVSSDVDLLPNIVDSWPSSMTTINYGGTESDWASLVATSNVKWSQFSGTVICRDTVLSTVTLHFDNATLGSDTDTKSIVNPNSVPFANPGNPVYNDGTKKFIGWYDDPTAGNKITFPVNLTGDVTYYAHFEDYGAGVSFANPIIVTTGNSYNYSTDATHLSAYFKFTADHDMVLVAKVTSAASAYGDYVYFHTYNDDESVRAITTGNSSENDVKATTMPSSYGVNIPLKVRLSSGDSVYVVVDGNGSASRYGDITVSFSEPVANDGTDYTTAKAYTFGATSNNYPPRYGVNWYSFTPETTGTYMYTGTANVGWCGGDLAYFNGDVYTTLKTTSSELNISSGATVRRLYTLTAGVTYYISNTTNTNGAYVAFKISDELDPGMARSTAITVNVDGDSVTVPYDSNFPTVWYKFSATSGVKYRLVVDDNTTIYTSGNSKPLFEVSDANEVAIALEAGRTAHDKVFTAPASGDIYVAITTSSSAKNFSFEVKTVLPEAVVTVYANGPEAAATSSETIDAGSTYTLANPTYNSNGFTYYTGFGGWFTDTSFNDPFVSDETVINANTSIYAKLDGTYQNDLFNEIEAADSNDIIDSMTDGAYKWVRSGDDIISTNGKNGTAGQKSSYCEMKFVVKKNCTVSFSWNGSSENSDKFYVYTRPTDSGSRTQRIGQGGTSNTGSTSIVLESGNAIEFVYYKDSSVDTGNDMITISGLTFALAANSNLTYNFNDGETADQIVEVINNSAITKITDPTRSNYRFDGWYTDPVSGSAFNFAAGISEDTTIYAHWIETVTVTIFADGPDAASTDTKVIDKGSAIDLSDLNTDYYTGFGGWFTNPELTNPIEDGDIVNSSISVYAKLSGNYRNDMFNSIDDTYADIFSNIEGTTGARQFKFDSVNFTLESGNKNASSSTCEIKLTLKEKTTVSFDWAVSSESGWDKASIFYEYNAERTDVAKDVSGTKDGTFNATLEAGTVITIRYTKDGSGDSGTDNLILSNVSFVKFVA